MTQDEFDAWVTNALSCMRMKIVDDAVQSLRVIPARRFISRLFTTSALYTTVK